jgi:hypothetical protein
MFLALGKSENQQPGKDPVWWLMVVTAHSGFIQIQNHQLPSGNKRLIAAFATLPLHGFCRFCLRTCCAAGLSENCVLAKSNFCHHLLDQTGG